MSRKIKFRVWNGSEFLYMEPGWLGDYHWGIGKGMDIGEDEPKTLEQYTGLKDSEGKEIYEGDIVRRWRYRPESVQYGDAEDYPASVGKIEYVAAWGRFQIKGLSGWGADLHDGVSFWSDQSYVRLQVIGNIHQHNHLLNPTNL